LEGANLGAGATGGSVGEIVDRRLHGDHGEYQRDGDGGTGAR
jgi:hypothetical protein